MAISKKMNDAFNKQINAELYSGYLYMAMAADCEDKNLSGFANWMMIQSREEMSHARKLYDFVNDRGGKVILNAIGKPPSTWKNQLVIFQEVLKHEEEVTGLINNLVDVAEKEKDKASVSFLKWFVDEQVEEEATATSMVEKLKLMKDAPGGIFMLDQELAKRTYLSAEGEK